MAEEIAGPTKYRSIKSGQMDLICYSCYANEYSQSWENLYMCYKDFVAGYEACNKKLQFMLDLNEALKLTTKARG